MTTQLKDMIQAIINENAEARDKAFREYIVEKAKLSFNNKKGFVMGPVTDWLEAIGGTSDDVSKAFSQAKDLDSFKELTSLVKFKSTEKQVKNGTFTFDLPNNVVPDHLKDVTYYTVSPFGQIRSRQSDGSFGSSSHTRMKSEKPSVVPGNPVASLVKNYDKGFKELVKKIKNKLEKA